MCSPHLEQLFNGNIKALAEETRTPRFFDNLLFAPLWCVRLERNACVFKGSSCSPILIRDEDTCLASR